MCISRHSPIHNTIINAIFCAAMKRCATTLIVPPSLTLLTLHPGSCFRVCALLTLANGPNGHRIFQPETHVVLCRGLLTEQEDSVHMNMTLLRHMAQSMHTSSWTVTSAPSLRRTSATSTCSLRAAQIRAVDPLP